MGHLPVFDLAAVTPANAEAKVREFADQLALSLPTAAQQGVSASVLEEAKRRAVNDAARAVYRLAGAAVPDVISQLTPEFDKHAAAYVDAVAKLPENITAETLVSAGADAVQAYAVAQTEAAYLNRIDLWVAETRNLPGHASDPDKALRILRPDSALQLIKLDEARLPQRNPTLRAVDPCSSSLPVWAWSSESTRCDKLPRSVRVWPFRPRSSKVHQPPTTSADSH